MRLPRAILGAIKRIEQERGGRGIRSSGDPLPTHNAFLGSVMDTAYMLRRDPRVRAFFESLSSVESAFRGCIVRACHELPPAARALVPPYP